MTTLSPITKIIQRTAPWRTRILTSIRAHKIISGIVGLALLAGLYVLYGKMTAPSTATHYVTTTVATSTLVATMSETGQVSASSNINIQSQSQGEVLSIPVAAGQHVEAGAALAYLDTTSAEQSVVSAEQALQSAKISLAKLQQPASAVSLTSAQNAVAAAQASLVQIHQTGYNDVSTAFLTLPAVITGLDTVLHGFTIPGRTSQQNEYAYSDMVVSYDSTVTQYQNAAEAAYQAAYTAYTKTLAEFKATSRNADDATIEQLIADSYKTAASISDALKAATSFLNFVNTTLTNRSLSLPTPLPGHISTLTGYTTSTNSSVAALSADAATIMSSERSLAAAQASLTQTISGTDPLDLQSAELSVQMKEDALRVAQRALANTTVRAPFSGTVAKLSVQRYETIGSGTTVATLVSDHQSVAISVNEVDAAKLTVNQKATITFDALPDISIAGTVSSVDTLGTVTSGVVSYDAVITFDTANAAVKPGMSASASIIVGSATGLSIPQSALKTANGQNYVLTFSPPLANSDGSTGATSPVAPTQTAVTTGLSNTTAIIITSGLKAGDQVVSKTIAGTAITASSAAQSTSLFGGSRSTGASMRAPTP